MTNEEILRTYEDLARARSLSGLEWIIEQVEETVQAGRPVEKATHLFREEEREVNASCSSVKNREPDAPGKLRRC